MDSQQQSLANKYGVFKVEPLSNSPMMNRVEASEFYMGHSAWIFTDPLSVPAIEEFFVPILPNTVYLATVPPSTPFPPFSAIYERALTMPIQLYLEVLEFFKLDWPNIANLFNSMVDTMSSRTVPVMIEPSLFFYMDGSVVNTFEIKDLQLISRIDSNDDSRRISVEMWRNGIKMDLNPNVMQHLSKNLITLAKFFDYTLRQI